MKENKQNHSTENEGSKTKLQSKCEASARQQEAEQYKNFVRNALEQDKWCLSRL